MKLPKFLTTITPLSKALALALFVALPFIGFYIGYQMGTNKIITSSSYKNYRNSPYQMQRMMINQEVPYQMGYSSTAQYGRGSYMNYNFVSLFIELIIVTDLTLLGLWLFKQVKKN